MQVAQAGTGHRQYSERARSFVLLLLAPIFLVACPAVFLGVGAAVDRWMGWPKVPSPPANLIIGIPAVLVGVALGLWSNHRLFTTGRGTPLPVMPTQQLIVAPPYTGIRNPMALGAITMYLGVSLLAGSPGAGIVVALAAGALLVYISFFEERELAARFGSDYLEYRRRTPFLLPHVRRARGARKA